jgi:3-hydroxyacyl-CoA dehydrogenase
MNNIVSRKDQDNIAVISVNNPPVNALSQAVRIGIKSHVAEADADDNIKAIILCCEGRTFMAGADITEFGKPPLDPWLPEVVEAIDKTSKPLIAAIHGTAFGGGLEVALGCNYRVAIASALVGTPEVKLGLLPGAGGTQRLPRIADLKTALDMVVSGAPVKAEKALKAGIIDCVVNGDLLEGAIAFANELIANPAPLPRISAKNVDTSAMPDDFFAQYRKAIARRSRGYFAPEKCIEAVEAAIELTFNDGLKRERELFMECMASPHSKALQHAFFAERAAGNIKGLDKSLAQREIKKIGIIGAGTMGGGISMNFLNAGIPVTILEMNSDALDRGLGIIRKNYEATAKKGRMTMEQVEGAMALLTPTTNYEDLSDADLIIEAVFENMDVKKQVFTKLDAVAKKGAILATNTSYLDINAIADMTNRPQDVLGLHFFSPANIMRLLEIVNAAKTAPDALLSVVKLAKKIKKVGVVAGVCHGFIGNRMLEGYGREAGLLMLEGASPQQIDAAIFNWGMPMGPLAMGDMAGIDIGYMLRQQFDADRFDQNAYRVPNRMVEAGRKGQKTGKGYYFYEAGNRTPQPDPEVEAIIIEEAAKAGIERRTNISDEEIVARCIYPLINEGAYILEEGFAARPSDIDVVWMNGYGFPPYRGGPMFYADQLGLENVLKTLEDFAEKFGDRWWKPAPLIKQLVAEGKNFSSLNR